MGDIGVAAEPVTLWCRAAEDADGVCVWHPVCLSAILSHRIREAEHGLGTGGSRGCEIELRGFFFAPEDGDLPQPMVGYDRLTLGDGRTFEDPWEGGDTVYLLTSADRPPRMSGGTLVDWMHFTASCGLGRGAAR